MGKLEEAQEILKQLGLPVPQQNELSAYTLLALCRIREDDSWDRTVRSSMKVSNDIMVFVEENYNKKYAPNTRETFRRQVLHQFLQAQIIDINPENKNLSTNSPRTHYALTEEALRVIQSYNTSEWEKELSHFLSNVGTLTETYTKKRSINQIPLILPNGIEINLSPGKHNEVQAAIINEFAPRFAKGGILLYLGDTAKKDLHIEYDTLKELCIPIDQHSKLPDVVILDKEKSWLFLIEAVTSHGPVSPKRIVELEELLTDCSMGKIYVSAFPNMSEFKKHSNSIAWDTEVWIMDIPDHMIHFNGDRFLGPR